MNIEAPKNRFSLHKNTRQRVCSLGAGSLPGFVFILLYRDAARTCGSGTVDLLPTQADDGLDMIGVREHIHRLDGAHLVPLGGKHRKVAG